MVENPDQEQKLTLKKDRTNSPPATERQPELQSDFKFRDADEISQGIKLYRHERKVEKYEQLQQNLHKEKNKKQT